MTTITPRLLHAERHERAKVLLQQRRADGATVEELASVTGVSMGTLSMLSRGRPVGPGPVRRVLNAFGETLD